MAKKKAAVTTVEEYRNLKAAIVAEELAKFDPDEFRERVQDDLARGATDIVMQALGFSRSWGKWEVDHCNGLRTAASDVILQKAQDAARDWLMEQAGALPSLPNHAVVSLRKTYLEYFQRELSELLRDKARRDAYAELAVIAGSGEEDE